MTIPEQDTYHQHLITLHNDTFTCHDKDEDSGEPVDEDGDDRGELDQPSSLGGKRKALEKPPLARVLLWEKCRLTSVQGSRDAQTQTRPSLSLPTQVLFGTRVIRQFTGITVK